MEAAQAFDRRPDIAMTDIPALARIAIFCFAAILFSATLHEAAAGPPTPLWEYLSPQPPIETPADARALASVSISLEQAISAASKRRSGKVIEIGLVKAGDQSAYNVVLGDPTGLHYVSVNPITGAVGCCSRSDVTRAELDAEGLRDLATLQSMRISLIDAVRAAETLTGGSAVAGGVEQLVGFPQYYVQIAKEQTVTDIIVNPQTGNAARPER